MCSYLVVHSFDGQLTEPRPCKRAAKPDSTYCGLHERVAARVPQIDVRDGGFCIGCGQPGRSYVVDRVTIPLCVSHGGVERWRGPFGRAGDSIGPMKNLCLALLLVLTSCRACPPTPAPHDAAVASTAAVLNNTTTSTTVYVSFGANSKIGPSDWASFCTPVPSGCSFQLLPGASHALPASGSPINATIAFDQAPGCNTTLAEFNLSIPSWAQDTANISLVNGWSNNVQITVSGAQTLGPTNGPDANADAYGVYPSGCDICVARSSPPCGFDAGGCTTPGSCGCKSGTQYNPTVPCQESFLRGSVVTVVLVSH